MRPVRGGCARLTLAALGLAAVAALSGCAFRGTEPACDAYGNELAAADFALQTPDSDREHAVSSLTGRFLLCGTEIVTAPTFEEGGSGTQFVRVDIELPPGVEVNSTDSMADGAHVGEVNGNMLSWLRLSTFPVLFADNQPAEVLVDKGAGTDCPADAVACYKATSSSVRGHNWSWVTRGADGRFTFTIGRLHEDYYGDTVPAGFTRANFVTLCARAGPPGSGACGDSSQPWVQRNGDASRYCEDGRGVYTITASTRGGETTAPVQVCVPWRPTVEPPPPAPIESTSKCLAGSPDCPDGGAGWKGEAGERPKPR